MNDDIASKVMEISWDYTKGRQTLDQAIDRIVCVSGLDPDIAETLLRAMTRDNVIQVNFNSKNKR